jgi:hypothetical protein
MPQSNFTLKITLDEANLIRESLRDSLDEIMSNIGTASDSDKAKAGAIDTLLRRDFG